MSIVVRQAGLQTTVQDLGRLSWQHLGVPVGGAMDSHAHRIANRLVGNDDAHAALECVLGGVALQFAANQLFSLAGHHITASLDGTPVPPWHAVRATEGALLVIHNGGRTTIAIGGGIDVPMVLGARGTSLRAGFGGWQGRALRRDDVLPIGPPSALTTRIAASLDQRASVIANWGAAPSLRPPYATTPTVRFIEGPEFALLSDASRQRLLGDTFRIAPDSDRMGFRLSGHTLSLDSPREMLSSGVTAGTIQLPPGGAPIVLMADRQTTGGYPRLGDVIKVDLPLMAQLRPGDSVRFTRTTLDDAHRLLRQRETDLVTATRAIAIRFPPGSADAR